MKKESKKFEENLNACKKNLGQGIGMFRPLTYILIFIEIVVKDIVFPAVKYIGLPFIASIAALVIFTRFAIASNLPEFLMEKAIGANILTIQKCDSPEHY